jgi:uncharacterized membrane protein
MILYKTDIDSFILKRIPLCKVFLATYIYVFSMKYILIWTIANTKLLKEFFYNNKIIINIIKIIIIIKIVINIHYSNNYIHENNDNNY